MAVELNVNSDIVPRELPRIEVQPVIRNFDLIPVHNLLLEDAVLVPETVAPSWNIESGHAVEEAGGKTTETTIAQSSVSFLGYYVFKAEADI